MATPFGEECTDCFTEEEKVALMELREMIPDVITERHNFDDDYQLIKWLRSRKLNVAKAAKMIRQYFIFINTYALDLIDKWQPPEVLDKYVPYGIFGQDRMCHPVQYLFFGQLNMAALSQCASKIDFIRWMHLTEVKVSKYCKELSVKSGRQVDQVTLVVDLDGLSIQHLYPRAIAIFKPIIRELEDNYPEVLAQVLVITNSPLFHLGWEISSHFIDDGTRKKIHFLKYNECGHVLTKFIEPSQLPIFYGGTAIFPDTISRGGVIPEKYYLKNILEERQQELTIVSVRAKSSATVQIEVMEPNSILCWMFKTDNYDISFGVYFTPLCDTNTSLLTEQKCVLEPHRVDCKVIPEKGDTICHSAGIYILLFDNSYSWFHNKQIHYIHKLLAPNSPF